MKIYKDKYYYTIERRHTVYTSASFGNHKNPYWNTEYILKSGQYDDRRAESYYVYYNNNQLVLRTVINSDVIVDITDTYIDITDTIKKVIFVDEYAKTVLQFLYWYNRRTLSAILLSILAFRPLSSSLLDFLTFSLNCVL